MLLNQRVLMNLRLALITFFLGILTAFMVWSLRWALESRKAETFDMPGDVNVLWMLGSPQAVDAADTAVALEELKAYLGDRSLALIISSMGDGRPEMLVYDPHGLLSWFPRSDPEDINSAVSAAYLFRGTYSERRWSESAVAPLLPKGVAVEGVITAPGDSGDHQYARRVTGEPLPPGVYTINTIDPAEVQYVLDLLQRMGLTAQRAQAIPLVKDLILNPLFIVTVLFLALGHVCAVLHWSLYLYGRAHEFGIRSRHGALPSGLIRDNLLGGLPGLMLGSVTGVILAGLLVAAIGDVPLTLDNLQTLAGTAVVAVVVATMTWSATLYVVIRRGYEVNLVA